MTKKGGGVQNHSVFGVILVTFLPLLETYSKSDKYNRHYFRRRFQIYLPFFLNRPERQNSFLLPEMSKVTWKSRFLIEISEIIMESRKLFFYMKIKTISYSESSNQKGKPKKYFLDKNAGLKSKDESRWFRFVTNPDHPPTKKENTFQPVTKWTADNQEGTTTLACVNNQ